MSQLVNAKDYISRQCTSILKGWYNVCLLIAIGLEMLKNWPGLDPASSVMLTFLKRFL